MIEIRAEGIAAIREAFARLAPAAKTQALAGLAQTAYDSARAQADTHTATGAIVRSLTVKPEGEDAWIVGHDAQHAPHAFFVHWGTKPHIIRPREKKMLRWANGGGFIFARIVHHPGYKGDAWLEQGADAAVADFPRIVDRINLEGR